MSSISIARSALVMAALATYAAADECDVEIAAGAMEVDIPFIQETSHKGSTRDRIAGGVNATLHGDASVGSGGATFSGKGYASLSGSAIEPHFKSGGFTISFWHSKEDCTDGPWEYVYSHNNQASMSILDAGNPNVNMYIGCQGAQQLAQSIMRTVLIDDDGKVAIFDYPLHFAGDFDAIVQEWIAFTLVVSANGGLSLYVDGDPADEDKITFLDQPNQPNVLLTASMSNAAMGSFTLSDNLHLGVRSDRNEERHLLGRFCLLQIFSKPLSAAGVKCLFERNEEELVDTGNYDWTTITGTSTTTTSESSTTTISTVTTATVTTSTDTSTTATEYVMQPCNGRMESRVCSNYNPTTCIGNSQKAKAARTLCSVLCGTCVLTTSATTTSVSSITTSTSTTTQTSITTSTVSTVTESKTTGTLTTVTSSSTTTETTTTSTTTMLCNGVGDPLFCQDVSVQSCGKKSSQDSQKKNADLCPVKCNGCTTSTTITTRTLTSISATSTTTVTTTTPYQAAASSATMSTGAVVGIGGVVVILIILVAVFLIMKQGSTEKKVTNSFENPMYAMGPQGSDGSGRGGGGGGGGKRENPLYADAHQADDAGYAADVGNRDGLYSDVTWVDPGDEGEQMPEAAYDSVDEDSGGQASGGYMDVEGEEAYEMPVGAGGYMDVEGGGDSDDDEVSDDEDV